MIKCSCGTLSFLAPEVFQGTANAGPPLDVWSMGVILFALVSGRLPFEGPDLASSKRPRDAVIRARIMKCQYKLDESLSGECKDLLRRLLVMDPTERMTIPELFNHIWVRTTVPAHVIESYKYEHFPTSERLKGDKDSFPAAQVHPLSLPDSTSTRPGVASPLPAEALTRVSFIASFATLDNFGNQSAFSLRNAPCRDLLISQTAQRQWNRRSSLLPEDRVQTGPSMISQLRGLPKCLPSTLPPGPQPRETPKLFSQMTIFSPMALWTHFLERTVKRPTQ